MFFIIQGNMFRFLQNHLHVLLNTDPYVAMFKKRCGIPNAYILDITMYKVDVRRIKAAEMKLLRPLVGYTLYDHKTNDYIRCELRITGILDKLDEYRRNWLSHLQRIPKNRIPLKSYHHRPQGRRTIGRPKKRWREQL